MKNNWKIADANAPVAGNRSDRYWKQQHESNVWLKVRRPTAQALAERLLSKVDHHNYIISYYNFLGIEYGNWVNNHYRHNYLNGLLVALHDLNLVLGFKNNLGLSQLLTIGIGSRGAGGAAVAHFEPTNFAINLTRFPSYHKTLLGKVYIPSDKRDNVFDMGGLGSFAHEYGHALDYFFGMFIEQQNAKLPNAGRNSITKGRSTTTKFEEGDFKAGSFRGAANKIIHALMYEKEGEFTEWYAKLYDKVDDYWLRHNEIFARGFEQYVQLKLTKKGISNRFLTATKYENKYYPPEALANKAYPLFDALVGKMATAVVKQKASGARIVKVLNKEPALANLRNAYKLGNEIFD